MEILRTSRFRPGSHIRHHKKIFVRKKFILSVILQNFLKILIGKPIGKRPLGRPRRRSEDNIRMDLEEIGINAGSWVDSALDRDYWRALVNAALNLRVP